MCIRDSCSILEEFPNLEVLELSFDSIKDFSFLKKLKNLKDLRLIQSGLSDLRILKGLNKLEKLDISENRVTHTEVLKDMKNLRYFKAVSYTHLFTLCPYINIYNINCCPWFLPVGSTAYSFHIY